MAVPKRRQSKTRGRKRRSHDSIVLKSPSVCPKCGEMKMSHRVCISCGTYKGRKVMKEQKVKE